MQNSSFPQVYDLSASGNLNDAITVLGGTIRSSGTWLNGGLDYILWEDVNISNGSLSIAPGNTIKGNKNAQLTIGPYGSPGQLYAIGTLDSLITFTSYNDSVGGWDGLFFDSYSDNGTTSFLKNCIVEKGNSYNVYCYGTNQPTIDSCAVWNSSNYGLSLNHSSPQIINSQIIYNYSHGIYLDGSSNPIIGNTDSTGCDIYANGEYDVYNNTTNDIAANFNFWNSTDSLFISERIYDFIDNPLKGVVFPYPSGTSGMDFTGIVILSGNVSYDNLELTDMSYTTVFAKNLTGDTLYSSNSNLGGYYYTFDIVDDTYILDPSTNVSWGGVNATDALGIMRHYAHLDTLQDMRIEAADVNASSSVNSTDALFVMQRYAQLIDVFPAGDWYFEKDTIVIAGSSLEKDILGICYGDVNSSYYPNIAKGTKSITLEYEDIIQVGSYEDFEIPVKVNKAMEVGAISLGFYYPEEWLEVDGVTLANGSGNIIYSVESGTIMLAWSDISPLVLNANEPLIYINLKAKDISNLTYPIELGLSETSELADGEASVIEDIILSVPIITPVMTGLNEMENDGFYVGNHPNPFSHFSIIHYTIPETAHVKLNITNLLGENVICLVNEQKHAGNYKTILNATDMRPGVYLYKIEVSGSDKQYYQVNKLVISK